tara:strand:+ start:507 stop:746 length:240 start_codon:yes stop_codon:yes gene_type:complete
MIYLPYVGIGMVLQMTLFAIQPPFVWGYSVAVALIAIFPPLVSLRVRHHRWPVLKHERNSHGGSKEDYNPPPAIDRRHL